MVSSTVSKICAKSYLIYDRKLKSSLPDFTGSTRLSFVLYSLAERPLDQVEPGEGQSVFELEWDNLVILDACRHDLYEEVSDQTEKSRISIGSSTLEYIKKTFSEGDFSDTVYVTGNPHFHPTQFRTLTGRNVDEVFHEVFHTYGENWDSDENTVLPGPLIRDAKTAKKLFPDKRLVVHFMQPHYLFVGSDLTKGGIGPELEENTESVWRQAERDLYDREEEVWRAYRDNLEHVRDDSEKLAAELEGKTIITSDHGNLVGENGLYGHPSRGRAKSLRKVPIVEPDK